MVKEKMTKEEFNNLVKKTDEEIKEVLAEIDARTFANSEKILNIFHKYGISEMHFHGTTGYGYNDIGRDTLDLIYADIFGAESAIVRSQIISGTHALTIAHFGVLRPNDTLLAISGTPYDSFRGVIGIEENPSSLISFGIKYEEIDLLDNSFDKEKILERVKKNDIKMISIQKSRGYSTRKTFLNSEIKEIIEEIKKVNNTAIIFVDNCYGELVEENSPIEVGADLIAGSLIKNLGGGIAPIGGYIAGKKELVELCAERMTVPGQGSEVGPSLGITKEFLSGLYRSPQVVAGSLKTAVFTSKILENLGYDVSPKYNEKRGDIVEAIYFRNPEDLIKYIQGVQKGSAIGSIEVPIPSYMPGYTSDVIMASGSFVSGSSIELSCDGPIREPYIAYQQGAIAYEYGKIGVIIALKELLGINE